MNAPLGWSESDIRAALCQAVYDCQERGLHVSARWAAELVESMSAEHCAAGYAAASAHQNDMPDDHARYLRARTYFDCKEFQLCMHTLEACTGAKARFLRLYSKYLMGEKEAQKSTFDTFVSKHGQETAPSNDELQAIISELEPLFSADDLDGFGCYLYGMALRHQRRRSDALMVLLRSISLYPCNWSAWMELAACIDSREKLDDGTISLPDHVIARYFRCYLAAERFPHGALVHRLLPELAAIFPRCQSLKVFEAAIACTALDLETAEELLEGVHQASPFSLEGMDLYSDVLFLLNRATQLASLAYKCADIDRYRPETCMVLGNYYTMRKEYSEAIKAYKRVLLLNRHCLSAWTLMGHMYLEKGNTQAAIECYRCATDIDHHDYRAWHGLGKAYEMLQAYNYAVYYYRRASEARPFDGRMWISQAACYREMQQSDAAQKCYHRALRCQANEPMALIGLAELCREAGQDREAANYYRLLVENLDDDMDSQLVYDAYHALVIYYRDSSNYQEALGYARKMLSMVVTDPSDQHREAEELVQQLEELV